MSTRPRFSGVLQRKASAPGLPSRTVTRAKPAQSMQSQRLRVNPLAALAAILTAHRSCRPAPVELPPTRKKTVVFDLDETLVHSVSADKRADVTVQVPGLGSVGLNVRPHARTCLEEASRRFEVLVFTASHPAYADAVLEYLDPKGELVSHRLYRDSCTVVKGIHVKDLTVLAGRDLSQVVLVDNSLNSFAFQLSNGVPVKTWTSDKNDCELLRLTEYFARLDRAKDVREVNKTQFHIELRYQEFSRTQRVHSVK